MLDRMQQKVKNGWWCARQMPEMGWAFRTEASG